MRLNFNENHHEDIKCILAFIEGIGFNPDKNTTAINVAKITSILSGIRQDFPHKDGMEKASIFKKAATLMVYFISEKPIESDEVGNLVFPNELKIIPNYLNTVIAVFIAFALLHNATIARSDGAEINLTHKIKLSKHSFIDMIDALSNATFATHFKMASVLLEQLVYKTNIECQYEVFEW